MTFIDALKILAGDYGGLTKVVGRPILGVTDDEDGELLRFRFLDGTEQTYRTEGDCCSYTWIEHLTVPEEIAGAVVTEVREAGPVDTKDATRRGQPIDYPDHIVVYHTSFVTDRGEIIVEYRNDSNGYYGGLLMATS